ncbi:beta/gamma crystallin domain-containing protein [Streptomyces sp. NPDC059575]|uniref:beta/gamma crystallin domain-containing protein n=1 Tax=Streptomyces sp. NPDC059575 TaxID=3346872 RepID=UPI0036994025
MQRKKFTSTIALAGAAAAALTVLGPVSNASAASKVPCTPDQGYLKIWDHVGIIPSQEVTCWAVAGTISLIKDHGVADTWIDRIQTGNNDVVLYDCNGSQTRFNRWTDTLFPNRPPNACAIVIL